MKKFLIFLVAVVVVVCLGVTTFYFMRNDETIAFKTKDVYCNVGDIITLDDLGYTVTKRSRKTTYDYNAAAKEVTDVVSYDKEQGGYVCNDGGEVTVVIKTSNKGFKQFKINFHIGDGEDVPYIITNDKDLSLIGTKYDLDKNFQLVNDITVGSGFVPIGLVYNSETQSYVANNFTGEFDGNGKTIKGLNLNSNSYSNAGLFYGLKYANVHDLKIERAVINGSYAYAGALSATAEDSEISRVEVINPTIQNQSETASIGGLVGKVKNTNVEVSYVEGANLIGGETSNANIGGLVGVATDSNIEATYAKTSISGNGNLGGLVGKFEINCLSSSLSYVAKGYIRQSYTIVDGEDANGLIGVIEKSSNFDIANANKLAYLVGNYAVGGNGTVATDNTGIYAEGFVEDAKNYYMISSVENEGIKSSNLIFYALSSAEITYWDSMIWDTADGNYPALKMVEAEFQGVSRKYLDKVIEKNESNEIKDIDLFLEIFQPEDGDIVEGEVYYFPEDCELDLKDVNWKPVKLVNTTIYGNYAVIKNLNISSSYTENSDEFIGMFSVMENSAIYDLDIVDAKITSPVSEGKTTYIGGVTGKIDSNSDKSAIGNVAIKFASVTPKNAEYFGGIAGYVNNADITDCSVGGLNFNNAIKFANVGALVGYNDNNGYLEANTLAYGSTDVNTIYGVENVGGAVGYNKGTINGIYTATEKIIVVGYQNETDIEGTNFAYVGGVAGFNEGIITDAVIDLIIEINNSKNGLYVGGVTGLNKATITNSTVGGDGIKIVNTVTKNKIYVVGGITGLNEGKIANSNTFLTNIGFSNSNGNIDLGKDVRVGGIAGYNSTDNSSIEECVMSSNLYGNYVGGVVVGMANANSTINKVLVAKFDKETNTISENEIKADLYVAGVCYIQEAGSIKNIQTCTKIIGASQDAKSSLIVLIFDNGSKLSNAIINNTFEGFGKFYRETWKDYGNENSQRNNESYSYNIYAHDAFAGSMQSVVISGRYDKSEKEVIKASFVKSILLGVTYQNTAESSFVKELSADEMKNVGNYQSVTLTHDCFWMCFWQKDLNVTKELTFNSADLAWSRVADQDTAYILTFLQNLK